MSEERVFEMLWDCAYCGTRKLLGLSHRHCPACGGAQDPSSRYFPEAADKLAVGDHEFSGADRLCGACGAPSAAVASHCAGCGAALDAAREVARQPDVVSNADATSRANDETPRTVPASTPSRWRWPALAIGVAAIAIGLNLVYFEQDVSIELRGHSWERAIEIERFDAVEQSDWCDAMPRDAYSVRRSSEVRSHRKQPDGEVCSTQKSDRGDGTFREFETCQTRYKDVAVHDDQCRYSVDRWTTHRWVEASHRGQRPAPAWPEVTLADSGECRGCERAGNRREAYHLEFEFDGEIADCSVALAVWEKSSAGQRWAGQAGAFLSDLRCGSLAPIR